MDIFKKKYVIEVNTDAIPVISPPCKYPIELKEEICDKLKEMKLEVIANCPDGSSSGWINFLAFSRKVSDELRICLDPRNLHKAINLLSVTPGVRGHFRNVTTSGRLGRFSSITFFSFFFLAVITLMIVLMLLFVLFFRFDYVLVVNC